ncbi:uncharacterized protein LOC143633518 [Bidens hawaiensis]|uniref:uncharacterized protein LOC143633518 n=1 Tax=Bidens hawaiensis TaxID=980011 RepID=UPI00404B5C78
MAMKDDEAVGDYFSRIMNNAGQQRSYGEELPDQKVVEKVLRSLSPKFDYVIPSIEVVYDLSIVTPVKLMGLLQSQEERMKSRVSLDKDTKNNDHADEQALQVYQEQNNSPRGRGRGGRTPFRGRGNGRGRGIFDRSKANVAEGEENNGERNKKEDGDRKDHDNKEERLFLAVTLDQELIANDYVLMTSKKEDGDQKDYGNNNHLWFIDPGCSNHMTGFKESFVSLDENFKLDVRLGDKKTAWC